MFVNLTDIVDLEKLGSELELIGDASADQIPSHQFPLLGGRTPSFDCLSGLYTQIDFDPTFIEPAIPPPTGMGEDQFRRGTLHRYRRFLESLEADSGKSPYDLAILRDVAALSDNQYDTFTKKIEFTTTKYKDAENFALAQLRTIMRE